jgi:hypothetical protein
MTLSTPKHSNTVSSTAFPAPSISHHSQASPHYHTGRSLHARGSSASRSRSSSPQKVPHVSAQKFSMLLCDLNFACRGPCTGKQSWVQGMR